jgi:hypothetical protein
VPKATVNEDSQAFLLENEIRLAWKLYMPTPTGNAGCLQQLDKGKLGCRVPF